MPHVVNGIGTWHYGRDRAHTLKGTCEHCNAYGNLTSYDTTLYIVVFFIPIIPLAKRRIIEECQACQRHRYMKLADWEKAKANVFGDLSEAMRTGGDTDGAIVKALGAASGFQDEPLYEQVAAAAAGRNSVAVQGALGEGYAYFARWPEAEAAFRKAMAATDSPMVREQLAHALLKQGRPDDALPFIQHTLTGKIVDRAWLSYQTVEAYQAQGRHVEALALMDARDEAFPQFLNDKGYIKQRKLSEKHKDSGKPIPAAILGEAKTAGYREAGATRRWLPRIVGPAIGLGLLALYFGSAWYIGEHRKVYLVNGGTRPYDVVVAGQKYTLQPDRQQAIDVPEGTVALASAGTDLNLPPSVDINTSFWSRPFVKHTFVINPDRLALVVWEEVEYAKQHRNDNRPPKPHIGELFLHFQGVDFEFQPFPASLTAKQGSRLMKERIYQEPLGATEKRLRIVNAIVPADKQPEYALQLTRVNPDDSMAVNWLNNLMDPEKILQELKPRLATRPVLPAIHRACQIATEDAHPETDQRPTYRKLVEETQRTPDALYLLGRVEDEPEAEKVYREAIAAAPSSYAYYGWAYRQLARGDAAEAAKWMKKAYDMKPTDGLIKHMLIEATAAAGQYQELDLLVGGEPDWSLLRDRLLARIGRGDKAGADQIMAEYLGQLRPGQGDAAEIKKSIEILRACLARDRAAYVGLLGNDAKNFEGLFLAGKYKEAAELVDSMPKDKNGRNRRAEVQQRGLLYVAALRAKQGDLAEEQWKKLLAALGSKGRRDKQLGDLISGAIPFEMELFRNLPTEPQQKRVLALVMSRKQPDHSAALIEFARTLDYERDGLSFCLRQLLPPAPGR
ncbi:MAG: hypothetical protein K1X57_03750 [Gemmataceae bacterium]|nr:hypothetical protein [Gemmataceae bacterium]